MVVGIVSDTHGYYHPALDRAFAEVDVILHAGDLGSLAVLDRLRRLAPVTAVYGNVDGQDARRVLSEWERKELDGVSLAMTHIAGRPGRWNAVVRGTLERERPALFVCGHSHILQIERVPALGNMLFLNPGAAGRQGLHRVKTCVRIHIESGSAKQAEVIHLDG